jgi:hypothetical protein
MKSSLENQFWTSLRIFDYYNPIKRRGSKGTPPEEVPPAHQEKTFIIA